MFREQIAVGGEIIQHTLLSDESVLPNCHANRAYLRGLGKSLSAAQEKVKFDEKLLLQALDLVVTQCVLPEALEFAQREVINVRKERSDQ
jgi:hypothetical protein